MWYSVVHGEGALSTRRRRIRGCASVVLLLLAASGARALSVKTVDIDGGLMWIGNSSSEGAPSPVLSTIGVALPMYLTSRLSIAPELDFFGTQYQLSSDGTRAIPTEIETGSQVWCAIFLLDFPVRYDFPLSKILTLGVGASPSLLLRVPVFPYGSGQDEEGTMLSYFYGLGRFFYPTAESYLDYQILPKVAVEIRLKAFIPLFHLWDGEDLPFWDQLMIAGNVGLKISMK